MTISMHANEVNAYAIYREIKRIIPITIGRIKTDEPQKNG